jgi:hypothetical protein
MRLHHRRARARAIVPALVFLSCALAIPRPAGSSGAGTPRVASNLLGLAAEAPDLDANVLRLALDAAACARSQGIGEGDALTVIDYSRPSTEPRMWVFDLRRKRLLFEELVAHGSGSGGNVPTRFSNDPGSRASSLGLFVTGDTYEGRHGHSLRLHGLERGINDLAYARNVVIHAADYVSEEFGRRHGRLGLSWGCPALRPAVTWRVIDRIKGGSLVFAYYPDGDWLRASGLPRACPAYASEGE